MPQLLLLPGDILLVRHKGAFLSGAIRWFESLSDGKPAIASHTGLITCAGTINSAMVTEALPHVVERTLYAGYANDDSELCVFRPLNLTPLQVDTIVQKARSYIGDDYGYAKLLAQAADDLLGGIYLFRRLCRIDKYPICSYVVGAAFAATDMDFGISYHAVTPDNIWDFCISHPDKYRFIWQRGSMYTERK